MIGELSILESGGEGFSRRSGSAAQGRLRVLEKSQINERQSYRKVATAHLRLIDLNLFRVFDAMMLHRSVRKASQMLFVSPSAVSHALNRLRQAIGDELFIRDETGMQPTQRALQLGSAVREGLAKFEFALNGKGSVPAGVRRTFRIWATDYPCVVILPALVKRLAKSAPNVNLRVFSASPSDLVQQLERGRADLVIGSFTELPAGIRRSRLLREDEVIVVRSGHPLTRGGITRERLLEFAHVVVEPAGTMKSGTDGFSDQERNGKCVSVETALYEFQNGRIGPGGRAVVSVPNFAAIIPFLQSSDMVAMLPRRLALWAAAQAGLALLDPPYTLINIEIEMLWVEAANQDEGLQWLLNELAESAGDL